jgi:hypothetical protein
MSVILTTDNTTAADINHKELYKCKWDLMTLMNNTLHASAFKFLYIFWPDDGLPRSKLVAKTNKIWQLCLMKYTFYLILILDYI